jgi:hypothetical protein
LNLNVKHKKTSSPTAVAVNSVEQKDLLNSLFSSSSPKSTGSLPVDNNIPTTIQSPLSSLYNPSATSFYSLNYHQRNSPPIYRPSSLQFDSGQTIPPFHDSHTRVKTPVFEEFLTPPSSSSYLPINNPSLSVHSYMNVSFQETANNPTTMTSSFSNHHSTTYPF